MFRSRAILKILILSIASYSRGYTQNLVYNGGFELFDTCPNDMGQIYYADNWFQPYAVNGNVTAFSSSDYYNACSTIVSVLQNSQGHAVPHTGNAYAGIVCFGPGPDNYREYIESKLFSPLKKDSKYCVEFHVSLADTVKYSINRMGACFSHDSLITNHTPASTPPYLLTNTPQIENDPNIILNDKNNWMKISGSFVAQGGEQYVTIGNFYDSLSTVVHDEGGPYTYSYYYIDDISVTLCDDEKEIPNVFTPNNDGINDEWEITNLPSGTHIKIYNRWGVMVGGLEDAVSMEGIYKWDGRTTSGVACNDGTYYYLIITSEKTYKGFFNLVKK